MPGISTIVSHISPNLRASHWTMPVALLALLLLACSALTTHAQVWVDIQENHSISGMARLEDSKGCFIAVDYEIGIVCLKDGKTVTYESLKWPFGKSVPDLEAIADVPGVRNSYAVLSSDGKIYQFQLDPVEKTLTKGSSFSTKDGLPVSLPNPQRRSEFEGLDIVLLENKKFLFVWASRGRDKSPGVIYYQKFDLDKKTWLGMSPLQENVLVAYPSVSEVRHISDLKIDGAGNLFISSASEIGNKDCEQGCSSAVYQAGKFDYGNKMTGPKLTIAVGQPLFMFPKDKVEAIEFLDCQNFVFGTDNEFSKAKKEKAKKEKEKIGFYFSLFESPSP